ncbi:FabD/lysophospholipase-like protein [Pyrenochaeta sp. DS3sAY3a]|nr:FabD/lysophospholipase-like protein [Pyrenochaeta sp. DS3sAY3a]
MAQPPSPQPTQDANPLHTTGLCLLALDGGGVRGLSTLFILRSLMRRLNAQRQRNDLPPVKPCDVFDLIGGTSTGGLIAIMLGRLEMSVDECIVAYNKLMKDVFSEKASKIPVTWKGRVKAQFDSRKLRAAVEQVVRESGVGASDAFDQSSKSSSTTGGKCRTFVCAVARETAGITRLRSYSLPHETSIPATISDAALATSAATGFFDPVAIGSRHFVDGALGANNPAAEVESEAAAIWGAGSGDPKPLVKCFVSIGTGNKGKKALDDNLFRFLAKDLVKMATNTDVAEKAVMARWAQRDGEVQRYFRFNVEQGLQDVGLAEYKEQGRIEAVTEEYLDHPVLKSSMRDCVENLQVKQSKTQTNFASIIQEFEDRSRVVTETVVDKPCWTVPFSRNHKFVGRDSYLGMVEKILFVKGQPQKVAISGLGGVGKTQIVIELAHRTQDKHPQCAIFWLQATSAESLQQGFLTIGQQLKLMKTDDRSDARKLVQSHLSEESTGQWLLIIDNIDDVDLWEHELKAHLPKSRQGWIVCTTRNRKVAVKVATEKIVEVKEMDEEMAIDLLTRSMIHDDRPINRPVALKLLEQLTFLPLAIVQAAAYMNENGITLSDYIQLLEEQEQDVVDLLSEDFEDDGRYQDIMNPVASTWLISFEQIRRLDPLAAEFLSLMACVDPKAVPQSLLPPEQSRTNVTRAIGTLNAYSFVSKRAADAMDVHRLVHLATRSWLRRQQSLDVWASKAMLRVHDTIETSNFDNAAAWRPYLAHADYVLRSHETLAKTKGINLMWCYAWCLLAEGRYSETGIWLEQALEGKRREFGEEAPTTLKVMQGLATAYQEQGRWKEAQELQERELRIRARTLGKEHGETLASMNNMCTTYRLQGKWKEAEEIGQECMDTRRRVCGEHHPHTLESKYEMALLYCELNRCEEARELATHLVEMAQQSFGDQHPQTLGAMSSLVWIYNRQERWQEAEELGLHVLECQKRLMGEEHPYCLITMGNLAWTYCCQGRSKEAIKLGEHVVDVTKRVLGKRHYSTLHAVRVLAFAFWGGGRLSEAVELLDTCYAARVEVLGVDHPTTATTKRELAMWRAKLEDKGNTI